MHEEVVARMGLKHSDDVNSKLRSVVLPIYNFIVYADTRDYTGYVGYFELYKCCSRSA